MSSSTGPVPWWTTCRWCWRPATKSSGAPVSPRCPWTSSGRSSRSLSAVSTTAMSRTSRWNNSKPGSTRPSAGRRTKWSRSPHAREFLEFCRTHRLRTLVLSSVHELHYEVQSRRTGFADLLQHPYVQVMDKRAKIHEILARHNLDPAETLFIGDMEHDIETARHGGVWACAVLTGYNTLAQLRASQPDLIVEHLGELQHLLLSRGFELNGRQAEPVPATPDAPTPGPVPIVTVGAAIFNEAGEVLMIRTRKWSDLWGIPGGKVKWGGKLRGRPPPRTSRRNRPHRQRHPLRAGAGLHLFPRILSGGAFRPPQLLLPRAGKTGGPVEPRGSSLPMAAAPRRAGLAAQPTHAGLARGPLKVLRICHGCHPHRRVGGFLPGGCPG